MGKSTTTGPATTPAVTVVYATHRPEPRFEWFADSLAAQLGDDRVELEVIVVDGLADEERRQGFESAVGGRFGARVVPAKPTPWNGPYRLTGNEFYAGASARNTGIVCATAPYVVFQDDCSVLMPGWWDEVREAARKGLVVAGACHGHRRMVVEGGVLVRSRAELEGIDPRWRFGSDTELVRIGGGQLATGAFGLPRALLLELNGLDELCDPVGVEVAQLGRRLELAGATILYSRRMLAVRSSERQLHDVVRKLDKATDSAGYMEKLAEFGVSNRFFDAAWTSSNLLLDLLFGAREAASLGNGYELARLEEADLVTTGESFPLDHWFDGQPLAEM